MKLCGNHVLWLYCTVVPENCTAVLTVPLADRTRKLPDFHQVIRCKNDAESNPCACDFGAILRPAWQNQGMSVGQSGRWIVKIGRWGFLGFSVLSLALMLK